MIKRFQVMAMGKSLAPKHLILVKIFFCKFLYFGTPCLSSRMLPAYSVIRSDFLWNGCSFASHGAGARIVRVHLWKGFDWIYSIEAISFLWEGKLFRILALWLRVGLVWMVHLGKLCLRRETLAFWPPLHLPVRTQVSDKNHLRRISKPIDGIKHSKPQIKFSQLFETRAWRSGG